MTWSGAALLRYAELGQKLLENYMDDSGSKRRRII